MKTGYIYGLYDSGSYRIFYIGATSMELKDRLSRHIAPSVKNKSAVAQVIREKMKQGLNIGVFKLETVKFTKRTKGIMQIKEKVWIAVYLSDGYKLVNMNNVEKAFIQAA